MGVIILDKLTSLLEINNKEYQAQLLEKLKWSHAREHLPPYYFPKDLENVFEVQCKLRERENRDSFDENLKGFTLILNELRIRRNAS